MSELPFHTVSSENAPATMHGCNAHDCSGRRAFLRTTVNAVAVLIGLNTIVPWVELSALAVGPNGTMRYPIPAVDGVSIDAKNEVIVCRFQNEVFAFALACPHQNTALRTLPKNAGFQCPRHKSRYLPNGTFVSGKATRNMDRLPITRDGNELIVDTNVSFASDTDLAKWTAAAVKL